MLRPSWSRVHGHHRAVRLAVAALLAWALLPVGGAVPAAACSSMAPLLEDVAVAAQVIVRAEVVAVHGRRYEPRYDLRVLEVLKGRAPAVIRGFEGTGEVSGGVCDEGWVGADPGDPVFLFLGTTEAEGTLYHPRLLGRGWSRMDDGIATRSARAAGITAEIRAVVPVRHALVPDALYLANAVDGDRTDPPAGIADAAAVVRVLHHADGQLSFRMWRLGGRRIDRFVVRAGDLAAPGPVLFRFAAQNSEYQAWAIGRARDAFRPSAAAGTLREALALVDAGEAIVEAWTRRSTSADGPRVHGVIRPTPFHVVGFTSEGRVAVGLVLPPIVRRAARPMTVVPLVDLAATGLLTLAARRR